VKWREVQGVRESLQHLLAKSSGELLVDHLVAVTRQAGEFARSYRPEWALRDGADLGRMLAYAALLHDFGKIHPGFQQAVRGGARFQNRHEILSLAFLDWLEIPDMELPWVAAMIGTHHKEWPRLRDRFVDSNPETYLGRLTNGIPGEDARGLY